jgi:hypothetical protein
MALLLAMMTAGETVGRRPGQRHHQHCQERTHDLRFPTLPPAPSAALSLRLEECSAALLRRRVPAWQFECRALGRGTSFNRLMEHATSSLSIRRKSGADGSFANNCCTTAGVIVPN